MTDNRIDRRFARLGAEGRKGLIPYVTAGHPSPECTVPVLHALVDAGADLLELGVPFSDVMADGPVIQQACERALQAGMTLDRVLAMVAEFRTRDDRTPLILMGYMNPIERRGVARFAAEAAAAGVDGVLVVDCPVDESDLTLEALRGHGLHQIFLSAPTTTEARLDRLASVAGGFIYHVSLKGVTGSRALDADALKPALQAIRRRSDVPVAVGFGVSTPEQACAVAECSDAVVIGSALVKRLQQADDADQAVGIAREFLAPVRSALDAMQSQTMGVAGR
ncbi:MAG: tryptophan synthase subunit alpha [Wenzhouxiangellaceae bacterium]